MKFEDVMDAFLLVAGDTMFDNKAAISRETGKVYFITDDCPVELPEDIEDRNLYLYVPIWHELGLGSRLVFDFARDCIPDYYDQISDIFSYKGAYRKFRAFLIETDTLQMWYDYELKRQKEAVSERCLENDIKIDEDK